MNNEFDYAVTNWVYAINFPIGHNTTIGVENDYYAVQCSYARIRQDLTIPSVRTGWFQ
jgi:hypothetical protein